MPSTSLRGVLLPSPLPFPTPGKEPTGGPSLHTCLPARPEQTVAPNGRAVVPCGKGYGFESDSQACLEAGALQVGSQRPRS
jgi:hypothetical protein